MKIRVDALNLILLVSDVDLTAKSILGPLAYFILVSCKVFLCAVFLFSLNKISF